MKLYLASKFELSDVLNVLTEELKQAGHEITVIWWTSGAKLMEMSDEEWYKHPRVKYVFERDLEGVKNANAVILVCPSTPSKFNGANIEIGYAMALGKPCLSIGSLDRSAMYLPLIKCSGILDLLVSLIGIELELKQ